MTAAGFSRVGGRGGSRIQGEALLFISARLFLAQAAELASRVSRHIDGRFPCHPQVMQCWGWGVWGGDHRYSIYHVWGDDLTRIKQAGGREDGLNYSLTKLTRRG